MIETNISTTSELMQDNSNELIFGQKHNDIDCALCPTAKRACDRAWVTAKQLEDWSGMSKMTLWRWLEKLEKARRIASVSDMIQTPIQDSCGVPHETTLYNLNVLNQLAMVEMKNKVLNFFADIPTETGLRCPRPLCGDGSKNSKKRIESHVFQIWNTWMSTTHRLKEVGS